MMIYNGDCLDILKALPNNSVDAVITDPPYGLSFMGKKWDYDVPSVEIWQECLRVLKHGGYVLSFAGTRTQHRMAVRIEDAGFEIRDMIMYVYGSGFPKSLSIGKAVDKLQGNEREVEKHHIQSQTNPDIHAGGSVHITMPNNWSVTKGTSEWEGWGTALKPALEPITVARKPLEKGLTVAENCLKWGVGGINIDGCRVGTEETITHGGRLKQLTGDERTAKGAGMFAGNKPNLYKQNPTGRFPANLIHDGSDEVVGLFPETKSVQSMRGLQHSGRHGGLADIGGNIKEGTNSLRGHTDSGSAARFFYCAKASKAERNRGCEGLEEKRGGSEVFDPRNRDGIGELRQPCNKNNHPTVKPIALMEYLIKLVTREGQTVLDPFAGSGTTGIACKNLNREAILIEREAEYVQIAECRMAI